MRKNHSNFMDKKGWYACLFFAFIGGFSPLAYAGCDATSGAVVSNQTVSCTGATAGVFSAGSGITSGGVPNVTVNNSGTWTINSPAAATLGYIYFPPTNNRNPIFNNTGSITLDSAGTYNGVSNTMGAISLGYFASSVPDSARFINDTGASLILTNTVQRSTSWLAAVAAGSNNAGVVVGPTVENRGTISMSGVANSTALTATGPGAHISNTASGSIVIQTTRDVDGVSIRGAGAVIDNAGSIEVDSPSNGETTVFWIDPKNNTGFVVNNSGTALVKGGTSATPQPGRAVVMISGGTANATYTINNLAGGILNAMDGATYAVNATANQTTVGTSLAKGTIENAGTILGNVATGVNSDVFNQTAGITTGNVNLGAGADTFAFSGGVISGSVFLGTGDDSAAVSGSADLSQTVRLDGGDGTDHLSIQDVTVKGFSGTDSLALGTNILNFESISLSQNGRLFLTGDLSVGSSGTVLIGSGGVARSGG